MLNTLRSVLQFREISVDPVERRLRKTASVNDLRRIAKRRLPGGVFDYIDGAAEDELSCARNIAALQRLELHPRVLRDVSIVDTTTKVLGKDVTFPLILAPTGFTRIADPEGELAAARAAERAGIPFTLSTMGTRSVDEVAAAAPTGRHWFQVYVWKDRDLVTEMIQRAAEAGFEALCVTVDTAVLGRRERDVRRGLTLPPRIGADTIIDGLLHPEWTLQFLRSEPITFASFAHKAPDGADSAVNLAKFMATQFDPALTWDDIEWIQSQWDGPVLLKGVQTVDDAQQAQKQGLAGVILSNHGGRQLDSAPAIIDLVAPVADAVGGKIDIICDGGIRRGSDIIKAVALGANAVMMGRPWLYALGAAGERGVDWVINHLHTSMIRDMQLSGVTSISDLTPTLIHHR